MGPELGHLDFRAWWPSLWLGQSSLLRTENPVHLREMTGATERQTVEGCVGEQWI